MISLDDNAKKLQELEVRLKEVGDSLWLWFFRKWIERIREKNYGT